MSYPHPEQREFYENYELQPPEDAVGLAYVIERLIARFIEYHGIRPTTIAQVRDALVGSISEFERCVSGPFSQLQRQRYGDTWGLVPDMISEQIH